MWWNVGGDWYKGVGSGAWFGVGGVVFATTVVLTSTTTVTRDKAFRVGNGMRKLPSSLMTVVKEGARGVRIGGGGFRFSGGFSGPR